MTTPRNPVEGHGGQPRFPTRGIGLFLGVRGLALEKENLHRPMAEVIKTDVKFVPPGQNLYDAFVPIGAEDFDYLPVVDNPPPIQSLCEVGA